MYSNPNSDEVIEVIYLPELDNRP